MKTKKMAVIAVSLLAAAGLVVSVSLFKAGDLPIQTSVTQSTNSSASTFTDSKNIPAWALDSANKLNNTGIMKGYSDGRFGAMDHLTRGQVVSLLYRTLKYKSIVQEPDSAKCSFYNDVKSTDYYYIPACSVALNSGSTVLNSDPEIFAPDTPATRADVAKLLDSMLGNTFLQAMGKTRETDVAFQDVQKDNAYFNNVELMYLTGLMFGKSDKSFDLNGLLTRAEISVIMDRTLNLLESLKIKELTKELGKEEYLAECADLINEQTTACSEYDNWLLSIQVSKQNTKTHKKNIEVDEFRYGPGNACDSSKAGEIFPANFRSATLSTQESGGGEEIQVICRVSCTGWNTCPANTKKTHTCTGDAMKTSDCLQSCDGTCEESEDQIGCSVCVPCEPDENDYTEPVDQPTSNCGEQPYYDGCPQCNGLPSYPTFQYENCLTACENAYQDAMAAYNACLEGE